MWKIILIVSLTLCFVEADLKFRLTGKNYGNNKENLSPYETYVKAYHVNGKKSKTSLRQTVPTKIPNVRNPGYLQVFTTKYRAGENEKLLFEVYYKISHKIDQKVGEGTLLLDDYVNRNQNVEVPFGVGTLLVKKY